MAGRYEETGPHSGRYSVCSMLHACKGITPYAYGLVSCCILCYRAHSFYLLLIVNREEPDIIM